MGRHDADSGVVTVVEAAAAARAASDREVNGVVRMGHQYSTLYGYKTDAFSGTSPIFITHDKGKDVPVVNMKLDLGHAVEPGLFRASVRGCRSR